MCATTSKRRVFISRRRLLQRLYAEQTTTTNFTSGRFLCNTTTERPNGMSNGSSVRPASINYEETRYATRIHYYTVRNRLLRLHVRMGYARVHYNTRRRLSNAYLRVCIYIYSERKNHNNFFCESGFGGFHSARGIPCRRNSRASTLRAINVIFRVTTAS